MKFLCSLCAALSLALIGAPASAANLVANGGFETGDFTGWTTQPAPSGSLFFVDNAPHTGFYSAAFGATDGQADSISQQIPTAAGQRFTLSFWAFNGGVGSDGLVVSWGGGALLYQLPVQLPANTWSYIEFTVMSAANTTELRFGAFDSPSYVYIDDVSVEPDNLITNPSFETGDFTGWNSAGGAGALFGVDDFANHTGTYGVYFAGVAVDDDQIWQNVPTVPGETYVLSLWVSNYTPGDDRLTIRWNGNIVHAESPVAYSGSDTIWAQLTMVVVANTPTSELRIGSYDLPSAVYVDDVYLARSPSGPCNLPGDADNNGQVNFADITEVLTFWGYVCAP